MIRLEDAMERDPHIARVMHQLAHGFHNDEIGPRGRICKAWRAFGASRRGWLWHRVRFAQAHFTFDHWRTSWTMVCGATFHKVCASDEVPADAKRCIRCFPDGTYLTTPRERPAACDLS